MVEEAPGFVDAADLGEATNAIVRQLYPAQKDLRFHTVPAVVRCSRPCPRKARVDALSDDFTLELGEHRTHAEHGFRGYLYPPMIDAH
jgi:hypothetical protein